MRIEAQGARTVSTAVRRQSTDLGGALAGGAGAAGQAGSVELDVGVEYEDGCQRSHVSRLLVPVLPPVRCASAAGPPHATSCKYFEDVAERGKGHLTPTVPCSLRAVSDLPPFLRAACLHYAGPAIKGYRHDRVSTVNLRILLGL